MEKRNAPSLSEAEVLLVRDLDLAFGLKYSPGKNPVLVVKGRKKEAEKLVWAAQELGLPIIENMALDEKSFPSLREGEEIPESFYRPVAHALALLYKTKPTAHYVRYVRLRRRKPARLKEQAERLTEEMGEWLDRAPVAVEVGPALFMKEALLAEALQGLRQKIVLDLGLVLPPFEIRCSPHLKENAYLLRLKESPAGEGEIETAIESIEGFLPLVNRLRQALHTRAYDLLGYYETEALIAHCRKTNPSLVKELFPAHFSIPALRLILRNLLREQISIRDLGTILQAILDNLNRTNDPDLLTEYVRASFAYYLHGKYASRDGLLHVLLLSPEVEERILGSLQESSGVRWLSLSTEDGLRILTAVGEELEKVMPLGYHPVILASPALRRFLRRLLENTFPAVAVLSYNEITSLADIRTVGVIGFPQTGIR